MGWRYYITDRRGLGGVEPLVANIARQIEAGVDWIQLREKDLATRPLMALARRVMRLAAGSRTRIAINSRMDVALAVGADGIHLPSGSPAPHFYKCAAPRLIVGVSCHNGEELRQAERTGADYAVLGPVFTPISKQTSEPALGLERFAELVRTVRIPVLALGGVTGDRIKNCEKAGAAGVAGISLFQTSE